MDPQMPREQNNEKADEGKASDPMTEAEIDSTLMDSFPASDPPSWTLGTDRSEQNDPPKDTNQK
jgi:hypothetical protein